MLKYHFILFKANLKVTKCKCFTKILFKRYQTISDDKGMVLMVSF